MEPTVGRFKQTRPLSQEIGSFLSDDEKKRRRKLSYAKRDYSKVDLLGSFQRWRDLRKKLNMSSDKELADFLMDHYESAQKPSR